MMRILKTLVLLSLGLIYLGMGEAFSQERNIRTDKPVPAILESSGWREQS